jgi:hypothetical protein
MELYKKQLSRRPNIPSTQGKRSSILVPMTDNVGEPQQSVSVPQIPTKRDETKKSIAKAYGGDEDGDLLTKLMDNLGADDY